MIRPIVKIIRRVAIAAVKTRFSSAGKDLSFDPFSSRIRGHRHIHIGDRVFIGHGADFSIHKELRIADDVLFGPHVLILSGNHPIETPGAPINAFHQGINGRCIIDQDVWIGARAVIMGDVHIGEGAVIGAGSIVNRSLPPYCISAGAPCRPIRKRFSDNDLRLHLETLGRPQDAKRLLAERQAGLTSFAKRGATPSG